MKGGKGKEACPDGLSCPERSDNEATILLKIASGELSSFVRESKGP